MCQETDTFNYTQSHRYVVGFDVCSNAKTDGITSVDTYESEFAFGLCFSSSREIKLSEIIIVRKNCVHVKLSR